MRTKEVVAKVPLFFRFIGLLIVTGGVVAGCSKEAETPQPSRTARPDPPMADFRKIVEDHERSERENPPNINIEDSLSKPIWLSETGQLITAVDLASMMDQDSRIVRSREAAIELAEKEGRSFNDWFNKNRSDVYSTTAGRFEHISSFGRFSANRDGISNGGLRHEVLITPAGRMYRMFPTAGMFHGIIEHSGHIFLITNAEVLEWAPDTQRPEDDRLIKRVCVSDPTYISRACLGKIIRVDHSTASIFGGFLVPNNEEEKPWRFVECPIKGTKVRDTVERDDGSILLESWDDYPNIVFDPKTEKYSK